MQTPHLNGRFVEMGLSNPFSPFFLFILQDGGRLVMKECNIEWSLGGAWRA